MNKYLKLYESHSQYVNPEIKPNVSYCRQENEVHYNPYVHDYSQDYLTITSLEDNNDITFSCMAMSIDKTPSLLTSTDNGITWNQCIPEQSQEQEYAYIYNIANLDEGENVLIKGENPFTEETTAFTNFNSTKKFNVEGNLLSIVLEDSFNSVNTISGNITFAYLFSQSKVVSAKNLVLPNTVTDSCYYSLFSKCEYLNQVPELPAITLAYHCYSRMFEGCTNLITAPILPATTLAEGCYLGMFDGCTNLINPPKLPVTTLRKECYKQMFHACRNLKQAPILPATTLADGCYYSMFEYCTSLTTTPELPATTLAKECYWAMFERCNNLVNVSSLPATTMYDKCYQYMFKDCTSLITAPELPATTLYGSCYDSMFKGCTSLVTGPSTISAPMKWGCCAYMFDGCISLTTPPALPSTTLAQGCYSHMFLNCISLIQAPEIPAITLDSDLHKNCFAYMFNGCSNLNYVKAMVIDTSMVCADSWLKGVAQEGIFIKNSQESDVYGVPEGWTVQDATE